MSAATKISTCRGCGTPIIGGPQLCPVCRERQEAARDRGTWTLSTYLSALLFIGLLVVDALAVLLTVRRILQ